MIFRIKEILDWLASPWYVISGRRPWKAGYYTAKKSAICSSIDKETLVNPGDLPSGYGLRVDERCVEYPWIYSQLPSAPGKVLDAGSALNHSFLLQRAPIAVSQLTIMTLAAEKRCYWQRSISYVFGDLRCTDFANGVFDSVVSVSTIEHIGLDNTMLYTADHSKKEADSLGFVPAVAEFRRILKLGGLCLITVPFGKRGVHGWYQVFDEPMVHKVVEAFCPSQHSIEYFAYRSDGWHRSSAVELKDAEFYDVHTGAPLDADSAAGARGIACLRLIA